MISVQLVPLSLVHQTWPLVEKFIEDALLWGEDDYTLDQAKQNLADGKWMLVVAVKDENIISLLQYYQLIEEIKSEINK